MSHDILPLPEPCTRTLAAVEADPLDPGADAELHMKTCTACAEARVIYLAQEDAPEVLAPAGYFERLPGRVVGKLPARRSLAHHARGLYWAAAAALLMAVGAGAFWAGRANRTPLVEATMPKPAETTEVMVPEAPFRDRDEEAAQLQALSPEEMKALLERLDHQPSATKR